MNPRENLISLYRRKGFEFVPVEFKMCPTLHQKMEQAIGKGVDPAEYYDYKDGFAIKPLSCAKLHEKTDVDWRSYYSEELNADTSFSSYGVAYEGGSASSYHMRRMHHPLAEITSPEELISYPWPEWEFEDLSSMKKEAAGFHQQGLPLIGNMQCTVWETSWYIRGMPELMMDMADEDEKAVFLLDRITADAKRHARSFAEAGADIIFTGDDIGMQHSIMMSLEMYRQWLKPRLAEVISAAREVNPEILVQYHSCGFVEPFIEDLIEVGVDILNPVQPECMDFSTIHENYGDRLSFNGTLGTQTLMPFGTPAEVRDTVFRNLDIAGEKGGLLPCPTHLLEPEVPWENVEAYILACKEYSGR